MTTERDLLREARECLAVWSGTDTLIVQRIDALLAKSGSVNLSPITQELRDWREMLMHGTDSSDEPEADLALVERIIAAIASRDARIAELETDLAAYKAQENFQRYRNGRPLVTGMSLEAARQYAIDADEELKKAESALAQANARVAELERGHCRANRDYCESMEALAVNRLTQLQEANETIAALRELLLRAKEVILNYALVSPKNKELIAAIDAARKEQP